MIGDNMKKVVCRVLVGIFACIAIFVTANLLAYNDYEVAEFGNKSFVLVDKHMVNFGYKEGQLLVITKSSSGSIKKDDIVLYYNVNATSVNTNKVNIDQGKVEEVSDDGKHFYMNGNSIADKYVLGSSSSIKTYPVIGGVLSVLESRVGYLLIILMPTLVLFAYLFRKIVVELKEEKKN